MQKILLGRKGQLMGKLNKETNNNVNIQVAVAAGLKSNEYNHNSNKNIKHKI